MYDFPHVWSLTRGDTCHAIVYNTNAQLTFHQCILVMSSNNNGCFEEIATRAPLFKSGGELERHKQHWQQVNYKDIHNTEN
jgi:hypothetical protein